MPEGINEPKSIPESNRIGGAHTDFAAPTLLASYEFPPSPSFRRHVAIAVGMEATQ